MKNKLLPTILATITLSLIIVGVTYADNPANVNYSVTVEPALNITTSSNKVSLDLNPLNHDFDSQDLTVSVSTNNETGYKLYVNTEKTTNNPNGNKLIEKDDNSLYIETLSGEVPDDADSFTSNRWGYKLNSSATNFSPFTPGILVLSSKTIADGKNTDDVTTMVFAAKVGYETKAGTYNLALNFQATANPHIKTIADAEYMQEVDSKAVGGCPADLTVGQSYALKDSRDGRTYYVARLKDGNCWMIQNLRLGTDTTTLALTDEKSNVSNSGFTLDNKIALTDKIPWETADGVSYVYNHSAYACANEYGCYYNWYTATAGWGTSALSADGQNVDYDICPAGWNLPTFNELETLFTGYDGAAANLLVVNPGTTTENIDGQYAPGFLLTGGYDYNGGYRGRTGSQAYYWSRTNYANISAHAIGFTSATQATINNRPYKAWAYPIRCLLK